MEGLHLILNWTALLLWVGARPGYSGAVGRRISLGGRLVRTGLPLVGVVLLLAGRAAFYDRFAAEVGWIPYLAMADYVLPFGQHDFAGKFAFSVATFGQWLVVYYYCLFFLSLIAPRPPVAEGWRRFLRSQLGPVHEWPATVRVALPVLGAAVWHYGLASWLGALQAFPVSMGPLGLQWVLVMTALNLQAVAWLALGVLGMFVIQNYVVLGGAELWRVTEAGGRALLRPLQALPLRTGRVDLAPLVAMGVVYGGGWLCAPGSLVWLSQRLPF